MRQSACATACFMLESVHSVIVRFAFALAQFRIRAIAERSPDLELESQGVSLLFRTTHRPDRITNIEPSSRSNRESSPIPMRDKDQESHGNQACP